MNLNDVQENGPTRSQNHWLALLLDGDDGACWCALGIRYGGWMQNFDWMNENGMNGVLSLSMKMDGGFESQEIDLKAQRGVSK